MEERERMETIPMSGGSKEQLFEQGHPVIRELKRIPEIVFEEQIGMLPSSAIPIKSLFARKQMDHYHVDSLILKKIAIQVLHILRQLSESHIYPGLIDLQDLYVDMDNSQYGVVLLHPEKFQLLTFEQDYEWYPEDERIFGDATLFDERMQQIADNRLIYKILVASARGNVKVPPLKTEADYSELFYNILPEEWKQIFEQREVCSYEKLQRMLEESIQMEEEFEQMTKENLDEKSEQKKNQKAEELQAQKGKEGEEEQFDLFIILRTELDNSKKISKMLYLLQDELELENTLSGHSCQQAFVFGNGAVQVKKFQRYRPDFRCQFPQTIREYSAGEALLIGIDLMQEKKEELLLMQREKKQEFCLYILMDGRIKNDQLFQIAITRLERLQLEGIKMKLRMVDNIYCEACQKLKDVVEDVQRCC